MPKRSRLDEHAFSNRSETRSLMVTAVHLAAFIERGEIQHHSFHGRPNVVRHLCQISILMEAVVLENWIEVALDLWKVPVSRRVQTANGKSHKRSNVELAVEIVKVGKNNYLKQLKLSANQRSNLVRVLNDSLAAVRVCFRIRNCIAHGDAAVVLTQEQRKRIHRTLTELMNHMNSESLQELLERTRRFSDCLEILISEQYQKWRLDHRRNQLSQLSGVSLF